MSVTILQVLAGHGENAWDLTLPARQLDRAWLAEWWNSANVADAALSRKAPPLPTTEPFTSDPLAQLCLRLAHHLFAPIPAHLRDTAAIILATTHGCLRTDIEFDHSRRDANARFASPAAFRNTLPTHIPAMLSVQLALKGPAFALSGTDPVTLALQRTAAWHGPLTLTGAFDWPPNTKPRALFLLCKAERVM
jgi:hypothetical protein